MVIFDRKARVLENVPCEITAQIARMHRHDHRTVVFGMNKDKMAATLTIFDEALSFEKPDKRLSRQRRQPQAHSGHLDSNLGHVRALFRDWKTARLQ